LRRIKPVKLEEIDDFLSHLAEEYGVPKPNYCVYKVICVKRLNPFKTGFAEIRLEGYRDFIPYGALFVWEGKLPYIVFLLKGTRGISRKKVVHEFLHYVHFLQRGKKPHCSREEIKEEERLTKKEVNRYWRKLEDEVKGLKKKHLTLSKFIAKHKLNEKETQRLVDWWEKISPECRETEILEFIKEAEL